MKPSTHQKVLELVREWFPSLAASPQTNRISRAHFAKFCLREVRETRTRLPLLPQLT